MNWQNNMLLFFAGIGFALGLVYFLRRIAERDTSNPWDRYMATEKYGLYGACFNVHITVSALRAWLNTKPTRTLFFVGSANNGFFMLADRSSGLLHIVKWWDARSRTSLSFTYDRVTLPDSGGKLLRSITGPESSKVNKKKDPSTSFYDFIKSFLLQVK